MIDKLSRWIKHSLWEIGRGIVMVIVVTLFIMLLIRFATPWLMSDGNPASMGTGPPVGVPVTVAMTGQFSSL